MKKLRFITDTGAIDIDADEGESVMDIAKEHGIDGIDADCGGSMVCGTCHVVIENGDRARLPEPSDMEREMLEYVPHPDPEARLSCQIRVADCVDGMTFRVPVAQR